jgi:hypothetical protein
MQWAYGFERQQNSKISGDISNCDEVCPGFDVVICEPE